MARSTVTVTFSNPSADPTSVIHFHHEPTSSSDPLSSPLKAGSILVSFLAAPINPQDVMVIAGRYPVKPQHLYKDEPVAGYDGVARVDAISPDDVSTSLVQVGDLVIPRLHGLGTWRSAAVLSTTDILRLPSRAIDPVAAALMRTVFIPAYLIVEDMRALRPGQWVVQNAGAGAIAQLIAQFARLKGAFVASVVRDRPALEVAALESALGAHGAIVVTESAIAEKGANAHPLLAQAAAQGRILLALDAVFGSSGALLGDLLSKGGTFVNFGSLGGVDGVLPITQKLLFWDEIQFRNFRLSEQLGRRSGIDQEALLTWFGELLAIGALKGPLVDTIAVPQSGKDTGLFEEKVKKILHAAANKTGAVGQRKHVFLF